ncbi:MAG: acetyl-CoA C-acyltransferase [Myxococcales bacterium]|nr:acetyl-CoA C-acyltransferase [Myxococcales bacterium]
MREIVIVGAARTPIGSFMGSLSSLSAPQLGALAIKEALARAGIGGGEVSEVLMGCVLPAGIGQAPARQAAIFGGVPKEVPCTTINKVCGSGLKAVMQGAQAIATGDAEVVVAGGMESMSNTPYLLQKAREGLRMGHKQLVDSMVHDGLWDVYNDYHMGAAAELCAREQGIDRAAQDEHARESYTRALAAQQAGKFLKEIVAVEVAQRKGPALRVDSDEEPGRGDIAKLAGLKPSFQKDGTVTAGNASSINDGAAAVVLMSRDAAAKRGLEVLGRIRSFAQAAQAPEWFTTAPAVSIARALERAGVGKDGIDLYEINEAFSVVAVANNRLLGLDPARVNVHGGAVALGHPIGASGARILVTLLYALADRGARLGCASLCIGGGEAIAAVVERA